MKTPHQLAAIAIDLAVRVRDEEPNANGEWLRKTLPERKDLLNLCIVLAAAVPVDQPWTQLTAWVRSMSVGKPVQISNDPPPDPSGRRRRSNTKPCGTHAAAQRHRYHGEPLCEPCRIADREWDRKRKRVNRLAEGLALVPREDA